MNALALESFFPGRRMPPWLGRFAAEPEAALDDLLFGRANLQHLGAEEPTQVLLDWLEGLEGSGFPAEVDTALAGWIERNWGDSGPPAALGSAALLSSAWCQAADLIAFNPHLHQAATALRQHLPAGRTFLSALNEGRARDPEGRAWFALARHQEDRGLLPEWWRLTNLPPDTPWYHGVYGIHGLRGLPAENHHQEGSFSQEVAQGLARLAEALARRAAEGWLDAIVAREEFQRTARQTFLAYPFKDRWVPFWRHTLGDRKLEDSKAVAWIQGLFPAELKKDVREAPHARKRWVEADQDWTRQARVIAEDLTHREPDSFERATELLAEQSAYAEHTGDAFFVVRSACNFAAKIRKIRPAQALEWALLARRFDPWHSFAWSIAAATLLTLKRLPEALEAALEAVRRFPHNGVARNGLAEVLRQAGRLTEAEDVYRETVERFPDEDVARNGLAEVLRQVGRLTEAEAVYRDTIERFPHDDVAPTGLAGVLHQAGRLNEAFELYNRTLRRSPRNEVTRQGLERLMKDPRFVQEPIEIREPGSRKSVPTPTPVTETTPHRESRFAEPQVSQQPTETVTAPPRAEAPRQAPAIHQLRMEDIEILLQDSYLLRRWGRQVQRSDPGATGALREDARDLLQRLTRAQSQDARAAGELGLLEIESGEEERASELLRGAARRFPGSARVRYALARAERAAAARRGRLDPVRPDAPALPWRRLSRIDPRLEPLQLLGEGRTWLAQVDGAIVEQNVRDRFGELGHWLHAHLSAQAKTESSDFIRWWAWEVQDQLFAGEAVGNADEVPDISWLRERTEPLALPLNRLEEDWVDRWAVT